ncbi:chromodomain-helicase-DNA-binding protein 1 isoform X2 [Drosophila ficusphila]|uniref:chromodomain-helicase-DNA-binding protein 1 isoform X2 n=1 Tax=Drosophila ficusphila TaxID=30025 RepID=UPI0007E7A289|nr:chromodomain-helicase-DNA-binding protein 1 isoform X2 [Drosophila ficusphila]
MAKSVKKKVDKQARKKPQESAGTKRRNGAADEKDVDDIPSTSLHNAEPSKKPLPKRKSRTVVRSGSSSDSDDALLNASKKRKLDKRNLSPPSTSAAAKNGKKPVSSDSEDDVTLDKSRRKTKNDLQNEVGTNDDVPKTSHPNSGKKPLPKRKSRTAVRSGSSSDSDDTFLSTSKKSKRNSLSSTLAVARNGKKPVSSDSEDDDTLDKSRRKQKKDLENEKPEAQSKATTSKVVKKAQAKGRSKNSTGNAEDPDQEWEVDRILDFVDDEDGARYKIRWKGFGPKADSWEPAANMSCDAKVAAFKRNLVAQENVDMKELRESPNKTRRLVNECFPRINTQNSRSSKRSAAKKRCV